MKLSDHIKQTISSCDETNPQKIRKHLIKEHGIEVSIAEIKSIQKKLIGSLPMQFIKCPECGGIQLTQLIHPHQMIRCNNCDKESNIAQWKSLPAISIKQPWAWLIVNGYKDLENRSTLKNFRGDVLIHASSNFDDVWLGNGASPQSKLAFEKCRGKFFDFDEGSDFEKGGIVGVATFTGSVTKSDSPWFVGPNAFTIENARPLPFTKCKGALGFFTPKIDM